MRALDNGSMDGFLLANVNDRVMSYYENSSALAYYWGLASHFTLMDMFFSSYLSYSLPNHWAAVAGESPPVAITKTNPKVNNATATELIQQASEIRDHAGVHPVSEFSVSQIL